MALNLGIPQDIVTLKPEITVIGVGGAGGNAVNNMARGKLQGANLIVANTDAQALQYSEASIKVQLGENLTKGLGAGASPQIGKAAAEESATHIRNLLQGSNMVFITAGMGGGTGTGAAPVIARIAKEMNILTVGVVTKPFHFEGAHRMRIAEEGLKVLAQEVDTLVVVPNQNLFLLSTEGTTFKTAFKMADDVLYSGVRSITDLMIMPGLINLDFADIVTVMSQMGKAMMGTGEAEGEGRAIRAAQAAISNPLLDHSSMKGARGILISITGGDDLTLFEVDEAANRIREEVDANANIIFGSTFDEKSNGKIRVSVVATGIDRPEEAQKASSKVHIVAADASGEAISLDLPCEELEKLNSENDNSGLEEQSSAPVDPRLYSKHSSVNTAIDTDDSSTAQKEKRNAPGLVGGLLGKMRSLGGNQQKNTPLKEENTNTITTTEAGIEANTDKNDLFEIPAFLRRQKK